MRIIVGIIISYLMAAPLTDLISLDMTQTQWLNAMTYVIWLFAGAIWTVIVFVVIVILATLVSRK